MHRLLALLALLACVAVAEATDGLAFRYRMSYGQSWFLRGQTTGSIESTSTDWPVSFDSYVGTFASQSYGIILRHAGLLSVGFEAGVQSHRAHQRQVTEFLPSLDPDGNVIVVPVTLDESLDVFDGFTRLSVGVDLAEDFFVEAGGSVIINASNHVQSRLTVPLEAFTNVNITHLSFVMEGDSLVRSFDGVLTGFPKVRFDIDISFGKYFVIGDARLQLLATYRHGLSSLTSVRSLYNNSLSGSIGFEYAL